MNQLTDEQTGRVIAILKEDPEQAKTLIHSFMRDNMKTDYFIDTSIYGWCYSNGQSEMVDRMSVDNLKQSLCHCLDFIEMISEGQTTDRDISDFVTGNYPGPAMIPDVKVNPGWQDKVIETQ